MDIEIFYDYFKNRIMNYSEKVSIEELLTNEFTIYQKTLSESGQIQLQTLNKIAEECETILLIIKEYKLGNIYTAYKAFNSLLLSLQQNISSVIINNKTPEKFVNKSFYRMRKSDNKIQDIKHMFHIPISQRNKVKTQRYSIPGCPCLYLGSSVYTCWNEMHQPPIHELYVSKFKMKEDVNMTLLNLTLIDPRRIYFKENLPRFVDFKKNYELKLDNEGVVNAFILWPLLFSCTIYGSNKDDSFKSEYIIPQFLLQWTTGNNIADGIGYLAAETDTNIIDPLWCINYVFPVKDYKNDLCSKLTKQFEITKPERCDSIENIMKGYSGEGSNLRCQRFYPGEKYNDIKYEGTIYGVIEKYLDRLETTQIS